MQPLSVQALSREVQPRESRSLIPPSQGLLTTTDTSRRAPVVAPANGSTQSNPSSLLLGVKLLSLHCPPLAHHPPVQRLHVAEPPTVEAHQHKFKRNDQSVFSVKNKDGKRNRSSLSKKQSSFNSSHDSTQTRNRASERFSGLELPLLSPAYTSTPMQGLRLQHCEPVPQRQITFPRVPLSTSSRPPVIVAAPWGVAPKFQLLHIEPAPKMARNAALALALVR